MSNIARRKQEHIAAFNDDPNIERGMSGFDQIRLTHRALPELNLADIDTGTTFLGKPLSFPLIISSMTGGSSEDLAQINRNLAEAAEQCGVAMAVGSQRIQFSNPEAKASFQLRRYAPNTVLLSNLGAVQLNDGFNAEHGQQAIDTLAADGIYLHLNPLQEAVQPEGDTDFSHLGEKISRFTADINVPVLLKEVGCGLSPMDIALGKAAGITHFDIAGRGGTSWSRVEYHRRTQHDDDIGLLFQDWGISTVAALKQAHSAHPDTTLIASGGIRNGIDMAKAIILGASLCGIAAPFLQPARHSSEAVIHTIKKLEREYRTALFLLGCPDTASLHNNLSLII